MQFLLKNLKETYLISQEPEHGGLLAAHVIEAQGVRTVFTLTEGHILPILTGCSNLCIRVVDTRHEACTVFAADAHSRILGIPGVAILTTCPGVTNTVTAIRNAAFA